MRCLLHRFSRREDGSTTIFATVVFALMVGIGGIAIDVMRFETQRVQLQYTLDRAVLAAASMSQTQNPRSVVESYFATSGLEGYRLRVEVEPGLNSRRVTARAEIDTQTLFMSLFGQPVLTSHAAGAAEERLRNIEISLVIDNSGSMNEDPTYRIDDLRPAARNFVNTVMAANGNGTGRQFVSMSLIPYDFSVNIGPELASVHALTNEHGYSTCARFYDQHFTFGTVDPDLGLNPTVPLQRLGHFNPFTYGPRPITLPVCRQGTRAQVVPWSNSIADLHAAIDALEPLGATASDVGMRWAAALLDPAARPALSGLVASGDVHADFQGRPAAHDDTETAKVIVLMTDGANSQQYDLQPAYRTGPSPFWRDPVTGNMSVFYPEWNEYWHEAHDRWRSFPDGGAGAVRLDYRDVWNEMSYATLLLDMFSPDGWLMHEGLPSWVNAFRQPVITARQVQFDFANVIDEFVALNGTIGDQRLDAVCTAAKARGIVIFTIAFDAPDRGRTAMQACASSAAHFYNVDDDDIDDAFASIGQAINRLRLVQ
jgi:hypothetical protein